MGICRYRSWILSALLFFSISTLLGCSSRPPCPTEFKLQWTQPKQLQTDIEQLASPAMQGRKTGTAGSLQAQQYIIERFQSAGLSPWQGSFSHPFEYQQNFSNKTGTNLIAAHYAQQPKQPWRIILAHYDHLGEKADKVYHGADDNASGVTALLALAAHISQQASDVNVLFVATDAEEPGLFGSYALVEQLSQTNSPIALSDIELAINLDMIGRPDRPHAIYLEGRRNFAQFASIKQQISQPLGLCIRSHRAPLAGRSIEKIDWLRASDHYPFHRANVPWLYFGVPTHGDYHQPSDTADKIDITFLAAVTESVYQLVIIDSYLLQNNS